YVPGRQVPPNVQILAHSPVKCGGVSDMTYYSAPSGAGVFASRSIWWVTKVAPPRPPSPLAPHAPPPPPNIPPVFRSPAPPPAQPTRRNQNRLAEDEPKPSRRYRHRLPARRAGRLWWWRTHGQEASGADHAQANCRAAHRTA